MVFRFTLDELRWERGTARSLEIGTVYIEFKHFILKCLKLSMGFLHIEVLPVVVVACEQAFKLGVSFFFFFFFFFIGDGGKPKSSSQAWVVGALTTFYEGRLRHQL